MDVILPIEYFGPVSSYALMHHTDRTILECKENYQKKSYRNRSRVLSPNGVEVLSVPLKSGKNNRCPIVDVEISYENDWIAEHLQTLKTCYGGSPYFEYYIDDIQHILLEKHSSLVELNTALQNHLAVKLDVSVVYFFTEDYQKVYPDAIDLRRMDYIKRDVPELAFQPYEQVWFDKHEFVKDLSILDLLFCKGPESILYLESVIRKA